MLWPEAEKTAGKFFEDSSAGIVYQHIQKMNFRPHNGSTQYNHHTAMDEYSTYSLSTYSLNPFLPSPFLSTPFRTTPRRAVAHVFF